MAWNNNRRTIEKSLGRFPTCISVIVVKDNVSRIWIGTSLSYLEEKTSNSFYCSFA
jgi:hypothetical protein